MHPTVVVLNTTGPRSETCRRKRPTASLTYCCILSRTWAARRKALQKEKNLWKQRVGSQCHTECTKPSHSQSLANSGRKRPFARISCGENISWPGHSAEMCRGFLSYEFWEDFAGDFLGRFSGSHKMRRTYPATKSNKISGISQKKKTAENPALPRTGPDI